MYIDEVGHASMKSSLTNPNERYLNLTAVIMPMDYVRETAAPALDELKVKFFNSHPDDPVIFHRKEMMNRRGPYRVLVDESLRNNFDKALYSFLKDLQFIALSVTIDKLELALRYSGWARHPYHYCLEILVERFVLRLFRDDDIGDVMAEARGGKEDRKLKSTFSNLWDKGNSNIPSARFQNHLTSKELKIKPKSANVCGLQIADLIAHPVFRAMLAIKNKQAISNNYGGRIYTMIRDEGKFHAGPGGKLTGWGLKWLP